MITLKQAIELATKAHEGQWRSPINASITDFESQRKEILKSGGSYILKNGCHLYEDKDDKYIWKIRKPYITHSLAVMEMMDTEEEKIVAVLHNVIESTSAKLEIVFGGRNSTITYNNIVYELPLTIALALHKLTHTNEEAYMDYIQKVATSKLATKVKLADIVCNLADAPSEHAKQKYLKALPILLKAL